MGWDWGHGVFFAFAGLFCFGFVFSPYYTTTTTTTIITNRNLHQRKGKIDRARKKKDRKRFGKKHTTRSWAFLVASSKKKQGRGIFK